MLDILLADQRLRPRPYSSNPRLRLMPVYILFSGLVQPGREISAFDKLEPYDGKLSCTVLRGERAARP